MKTYQDDFTDFEGQVWLNAASQGALPLVAVKALHEATEWMSLPYFLSFDKFTRVPLRLRTALGYLLGVNATDVILGNSASYGLHLLANGLPLSSGDDVIVMQNDFPSDILPWLGLAKKGVQVRQLHGAGPMLTADEIAAAVVDRTRVVCLSHVHTFSGHRLDVAGIANVCRQNNIWFILNISQSAGAEEVNALNLSVDALVGAGYKWLLGPYGTGFLWMHPELRADLDINWNYWTATLTGDELKSEGDLIFKDFQSARKYDIFATANFFNFMPWTASVEYLLQIGPRVVQNHNQTLIDVFLEGLNRSDFHLISPKSLPERTNLVVFTHRQAIRNENIFQQLKALGIHLAFWKGNLRFAPHIFNTRDEVNRLLTALHELGGIT